MQAVPVPLSKADSVKKIFDLAAQRLGLEFSVVNPGEPLCNFFYGPVMKRKDIRSHTFF